MNYQDDFDRIHSSINALGRKLRDDPDVQDALAKLGGRRHTPLEVECALDGHRIPPRHTFTAVGYPTLSGEVLEYSPEPIEEGIGLTDRISDLMRTLDGAQYFIGDEPKAQEPLCAVEPGRTYRSPSGLKFEVLYLARHAQDCSWPMVVYRNLEPTKDAPTGTVWTIAESIFLRTFSPLKD